MQGSGKARGEAVRRLREAKPWTQAQLAAAAGVSTRTIMRVEAGEETSAETLMALCAALDVPAADIVMEQGSDDGARARDVDPAVEPAQAPVTSPEPPRVPSPPGSGRMSWGLRGGRLVLRSAVCLGLAFALATAGAAVGIHAAWKDSLPYHSQAEVGLDTFWTTVRLREINLLSVRYSSLVDGDAPERSWEIWQEPLALRWTSCERDGRGPIAAYRMFVTDLFGDRRCDDVGPNISIAKRDEAMTEAVIGSLGAANLRAVALGLTGDPSVRVGVMWTRDKNSFPIGSRWTDPRREAIDIPSDGVGYLRIRFTGEGR